MATGNAVNQSYSSTTDGRKLLEISAADLDTTTEALLDLARASNVEVVWIHGGDFSSAGFTRRQGFIRLSCTWAKPTHSRDELCLLSENERVELMNSAYGGVWGHHPYDPALDSSDTGRCAAGTYVDDHAVGICTFWPDQRLVDGPGLRPPYRNAERKVELLRLVCNELGEGSIELETWGEDSESLALYRQLGFDEIENEVGWELRLGTEHGDGI